MKAGEWQPDGICDACGTSQGDCVAAIREKGAIKCCPDCTGHHDGCRMEAWNAAAERDAALALVEAVEALHRPFGIYDDCDHPHTEDDVAAGRAIDTGFSYSCDDALMYHVCRACCTVEGEQTEDCVTYHEHATGGPICPTIAALASAGDAEAQRS